MAKIGRNDPCPCGSGKKYKQCCLGTEVRTPRETVSTPDEAIAWLERHHGEALAMEIRHGFVETLEDEDLQKLDELPPELAERFAINLNDWLLAEGILDLQGIDLSVADLLLSQRGPLLDPELVEWIDALANSSLELYEVQKEAEGGEVRLLDVFDRRRGPIFVSDDDEELSLASMDLVGARILSLGDDLVLSGAIYPFEKRHLAELRSWREEDRDYPTSATIVDAWVGLLVDPESLGHE